MASNIYLVGFSGAGKSTVGRLTAELTGRISRDTDVEIEARTGRSIEDIFREDGEPAFRDLERDALRRLAASGGQVVATGGGIVLDEGNRRAMRETGVVVCLEAQPETILRRLSQPPESEDAQRPRPLLQAEEPLARIAALKGSRQALYALADWTVHTDTLTLAQVAAEVARASTLLVSGAAAGDGGDEHLAANVTTSSSSYPVWVGWGIAGGIGERVKTLVDPGAAYVITDDRAQRHARKAQESIEGAGVPCHIFVMESGEPHKNLATVSLIYQWLASLRAERGHLVVAVGGGVVGDVAGYAAATYLRGLRVAQVPTTLVAMMDAAIGGKTGVDLPQGKNLVGAFKQPEFVLADVEALATLPARTLTSGWAEAVKHALILDESLLRLFEREGEAIRSLEPSTASEALRRSVGIKADVVSRDERETLGIRALLNYGHTTAHALEAVTGYERYLHGEAVSIGMTAAARIANALGMLSAEEVERQSAVLRDYGLPLAYRGVDPSEIRRAMSMDKKKIGGRIRWVLLNGIGNAATIDQAPEDVIDRALRETREL